MSSSLQLLELQLSALGPSLSGGPDAPRLLSMRRAADTLRVLARDILDADRICRGQFAMTFAEHDLCALVREVIAACQPLCLRRRIVLSLVAPNDELRLRCDSVRLGQVLANVLGNAIKFSPADAAVLVRIAARGDEAACSVTDAGAGIAPEYRNVIFERRWQVPGEQRGHGIGLFVARSIVEAHGGRIWVEDAESEGTTFVLQLPRDGAASNGNFSRL